MDELVVVLTTSGVCFSYSKSKLPTLINSAIATGQSLIVNVSIKEKIRSVFLNQINESIFVVSVREKPDCAKMKCRSLPIK